MVKSSKSVWFAANVLGIALATACGGNAGTPARPLPRPDIGNSAADAGTPTFEPDAGYPVLSDAGPSPVGAHDGAAQDSGPTLDVDAGPPPVTVPTDDQVHAILIERCAACHGGTRAAGGYAIGIDATVVRTLLLGVPRRAREGCDAPLDLVRPGDPDGSYFFLKLLGTHGENCGAPMPKGGEESIPLVLTNPEEVDAIRVWIESMPAPILPL